MAPALLVSPWSHTTHVADDVAPTAAEKLPGVQATQLSAPAPAQVPAGQSVHPPPATGTEPAAHGVAGTATRLLAVDVAKVTRYAAGVALLDDQSGMTFVMPVDSGVTPAKFVARRMRLEKEGTAGGAAAFI